MDNRDKILLIENNEIPYLIHIKEDRIVHVEREEYAEYPIGTIVLGRVMSIKKELSAAFVSLEKNKAGEEIVGYLPINKIKSKINKCGDLIPVQVKTLSTGMKNCELTEQISLVGRYCVVSHGEGRVYISPRIPKDRAKSLGISRETLENTAFFEENGAFDNLQISVRTNAASAERDEVLTEIFDLISQLRNVDRKSQISNDVSIQFLPNFIFSYLNSLPHGSYEVVTESKELFRRITAQGYECRQYSEPKISLKRVYCVETKLRELLSPKVYLKSGGFLMIERTEALISVDINSGQMERAEDKDAFFMRVNLEACDEIFRQLQVRNLSGIIIIDFINMKKEGHITAVTDHLTELFKQDTVHTELSEFTKLGLAECTRQKRGHSIDIVLRDYIFD